MRFLNKPANGGKPGGRQLDVDFLAGLRDHLRDVRSDNGEGRTDPIVSGVVDSPTERGVLYVYHSNIDLGDISLRLPRKDVLQGITVYKETRLKRWGPLCVMLATLMGVVLHAW